MHRFWKYSAITKYYDNIPITKQFFDYNEDFRNLLREIIPASQLQNDNGWKGNIETLKY
jgi:hypothetical protein